ncbi:TPA_asm: putative excisionase [Cyanophage Cy-LDV1]|nr:TPA_asm: putative excisionase [Cyanophage Cy-LDV1]
MNTEERPIAISPKKAAALASMSRTRIFALLKTWELPSFKCGRKRLIRYTDLCGMIDRMASEACGSATR